MLSALDNAIISITIIFTMSAEPPTKSAEPEISFQLNFLIGIVNIALFFMLLNIFFQYSNLYNSLNPESLSVYKWQNVIWISLIWIFIYSIYTFCVLIMSVIETEANGIKRLRTSFINNFSAMLFITCALIYLAWLFSIIYYVVTHSDFNISLGYIVNFITTLPYILFLSSVISFIAIIISMTLSRIRYCCNPDYVPLSLFDFSNCADSTSNNRFLNALWQSHVEIWRQIAIVMLWIMFPLLFLTIRGLCLPFVAVIRIAPIIPAISMVFNALLIQIAYIVFNVLMRRLYARIGNRTAARER